MQNRNNSRSEPNPDVIHNLPPRGLKIEQAAAYSGLSPWHVELIIRSGDLPALKLCRHYVILREDLDAYLDKHRAKLDGPEVVQ